MNLSVYLYHPDEELCGELQGYTAAVLFNADYRAKIYAARREEQIKSIIERFSSDIDIMILPSGENGFRLGNRLRCQNRHCALVYVEGDMDRILNAFSSMPMAYILGREKDHFFSEALLRAANWALKEKNHFCYETKSELLRYPYNRIEYFESNYRIVYIHLDDGEVKTINARLDDIQDSLPGEYFCRCHKSYLVNLKHIDTVDKTNKRVYLNSGRYVYASKALYPDLVACLLGGATIETV